MLIDAGLFAGYVEREVLNGNLRFVADRTVDPCPVERDCAVRRVVPLAADFNAEIFGVRRDGELACVRVIAPGQMQVAVSAQAGVERADILN